MNNGQKQFRLKIVLSLIFLFFSLSGFSDNGKNTINHSAALQTLKKASVLVEEERWSEALNYAQLGKIYAPKFADFFYLEALCGMRLGQANADIIENAEKACSAEMSWGLYDLANAELLAAKINAELLRYERALHLAGKQKFASADADLLKARALYGLSRNEEARKEIDEALGRWALDPRFAKLFFLKEKGKKVTASSRALAKKILMRLYSWQELDPSLLLLASPFETKSEENIRRIKIYRSTNMPTNKPCTSEELLYYSYSALLALRYGIINEETAVDEFFHLTSYYNNPISKEVNLIHTAYESHLEELLKLVVTARIRAKIKKRLDTYHGLILDDKNNDLIVNSKIYYRNGRPWSAEFNDSQDGYPEYIVKCSFGVPDIIYGKRNNYELRYDNYPFLKEAEINKKAYKLLPQEVKWQPLFMEKVNLKLYKPSELKDAFFSLKTAKNKNPIQEKDIIGKTIFSVEDEKSVEGGKKTVYYEKGIPSKDDVKVGGEIYSATNYKNGLPLVTTVDKDGDKYFETKIEYDRQGLVAKISVDLNKNKIFEYVENYPNNSSVVKTWDTNEDGRIDITHSIFKNGNAITEWQHPTKNKQVSVLFSDGIPKKLVDGKKETNIITMSDIPVYWLKQTPPYPKKINEKILEIFNQNELSVVSYMLSINELEVYAIRSGGFIFAEIISE